MTYMFSSLRVSERGIVQKDATDLSNSKNQSDETIELFLPSPLHDHYVNNLKLSISFSFLFWWSVVELRCPNHHCFTFALRLTDLNSDIFDNSYYNVLRLLFVGRRHKERAWETNMAVKSVEKHFPAAAVIKDTLYFIRGISGGTANNVKRDSLRKFSILHTCDHMKA